VTQLRQIMLEELRAIRPTFRIADDSPVVSAVYFRKTRFCGSITPILQEAQLLIL